jgi:sulfoxide reductase catalytic subunit YedY
MAAKHTVGAILVRGLNSLKPQEEYARTGISLRFWPNGTLPTSEEWITLASGDFQEYRLRVYGLVENPVDLSLEDLKAMDKQEQTTMHHCIQGWSGIAEWGGLSMTNLMELVRPQPGAKVAVFYSFGESHLGRPYYDTHTIKNLGHPQSL